MRVSNQAYTGVLVEFYLNPYRMDQPYGTPLRLIDLKHDEFKDIGLGHDQVQIRVRVNRPGASPTVLYDSNQEGAKTFSNRRHYVITQDAKKRVINWSDCRSKWSDSARSITLHESEANAGVQDGTQIATTLVMGLATGLAAAGGPLGMAGGGLTAGLGPLLLMAFSTADKVSVPPPPDIGAIEAAVEKVIKRELDKQDAVAIASNFYGVSDRFLRLAGKVYEQWLAQKGQQTWSPLDEKLAEDLGLFIKGIQNNTTRGSLLSDIDLLCSEPEITKYMIPAFIAGIATSLHVLRLHELDYSIKKRPDGSGNVMQVSLSSVRNMRDHLAKCVDGLERAVEAYKAHRTELVKEEGLLKTAMQVDLEGLIDRAILGLSNLAPIEATLQELRAVQARLDEDLNSGQVQHFWGGWPDGVNGP